ncbi:MAG: bile acid:sodium symporter [Cyclobacteriaceae bacterium]|nr:bile acid:sodium symporter [Cyclobacteriaceae bacterium]
MKLDRFVLLLVGTILLAYLVPGIEDILPLKTISSLGISGIFFFYGLKLSPKKMLAGLFNWRLHLLIQLATFVLFPLLVLAARPFIHSEAHLTLWLAVFFLAALPSTVSSSVVMVSIAKGNVPGAIFNASISGLIGIVVTPLWMGMFLGAVSGSFDLAAIFLELVLKILLPVALGLLMHRFWGGFADRNKQHLTTFDKSVILIIVYNSFSHSFSSGIFEGIGVPELGAVALGVTAMFFVIYFTIYTISKSLGFHREDQIAALFCGSKKSLVHGSVFSNVLFAGMASAGIFLVPVMVYHAFQLFIVSIIAQKMANNPSSNSAL